MVGVRGVWRFGYSSSFSLRAGGALRSRAVSPPHSSLLSVLLSGLDSRGSSGHFWLENGS